MRLVGREFKPKEPYTHRIRKILEEYPDGSQVLREILQNSDDAKSNEQIFILDHNTYPSGTIFDRKLDRYQGPSLLAKNNTIFEERDFQSLLKLADSEKRDQFDKIGGKFVYVKNFILRINYVFLYFNIYNSNI